MRGIREIAIIALESGQTREAEMMLRQLLVAQLEELGSLNEETQQTLVLLAYSLAMSDTWNEISELLHLLEAADKQTVGSSRSLLNSIEELRHILAYAHKENQLSAVS